MPSESVASDPEPSESFPFDAEPFDPRLPEELEPPRPPPPPPPPPTAAWASGARTFPGPAVGLLLRLDRHVVDLIPSPVALLALGAEGFQQPRADLLAGHLDEAEAGHLGDLVAGPVPAEALDQPPQQ